MCWLLEHWMLEPSVPFSPDMPDGTWELVTHPGYNDGDLAKAGTRLLASRNVEREALLALQQRDEMELISFAALAAG